MSERELLDEMVDEHRQIMREARSRVYEAGPIKRRRRTRAQIEQLERQIVEIVARDRPVSIRNVFYQLTDPRLPEPIDKSDRGYNQVQARLTKLRRAGRIPYSSISDMSWRGYFVDTFNGAGDFLRKVKGLYRADLWRQAEYYVEVWVEFCLIAGIIQDDCEELAVSLYPCGGFPSITLAYQAAEFINGSKACPTGSDLLYWRLRSCRKRR